MDEWKPKGKTTKRGRVRLDKASHDERFKKDKQSKDTLADTHTHVDDCDKLAAFKPLAPTVLLK